MKQQLVDLIHSKAPGSKPLFLVVRGSHAYGTNIETSDVDYAGVFIQSLDDILGNRYVEQVNDDKNDIVIYEIRRFLELLGKNNPTVLELLNTPEDCVVYKDPVFDLILENRDQFITKVCARSFGGYATTQINKSKGLNKKQNWEKDKVTRKDLLDFCYVIEGEKSIPWRVWNADTYEEKFIGAVNVPHAKDIYALYYDINSYHAFSDSIPEHLRRAHISLREQAELPIGLGYKGLVKVGVEGGKENYGISNQLRLSSIPKGETPICTIFYNKDGYSEHCKDFREYEEWLEKRNMQRWVDVKSHGQQIDGKNMLHCVRLVDMSREIAEGKGIIVRRPNAEQLLAIRRGEIDLQSLIDYVEKEIVEIDRLFAESNLPESVSEEFINDLLIKIRKISYGF